MGRREEEGERNLHKHLQHGAMQQRCARAGTEAAEQCASASLNTQHSTAAAQQPRTTDEGFVSSCFIYTRITHTTRHTHTTSTRQRAQSLRRHTHAARTRPDDTRVRDVTRSAVESVERERDPGDGETAREIPTPRPGVCVEIMIYLSSDFTDTLQKSITQARS